MEYNFRTALIVISAVVITAIFVHGFWTIRKNKNPYKLKAKSKSKTENVTGISSGRSVFQFFTLFKVLNDLIILF